MGKHDAPEVWAICRDCGKTGNITRKQSQARLVCAGCGSRDYSLTINDPSKPARSAQRDAGEIAADVRLPPLPPIDPEAWRRGSYP